MGIEVNNYSERLKNLNERLRNINRKLAAKEQEKIEKLTAQVRNPNWEKEDRQGKAERIHIERIRKGSTTKGGRRTKFTFKKRNQRKRKYRTKKFHKKRGTRRLRKK